jgi:hypothetical protein
MFDVSCKGLPLGMELIPQLLYITRSRVHSKDIIKRLVVLDVMARTLIVSSVSEMQL